MYPGCNPSTEILIVAIVSSRRHQFVDNNLIIKTGVVDKRKVSSAISRFQRNSIELQSGEKFVSILLIVKLVRFDQKKLSLTQTLLGSILLTIFTK